MAKEDFDLTNIIHDGMSDEDKANLQADAALFFSDDDDNIKEVRETPSKVSQGASGVQNVDQIIKDRSKDNSSEISNEDLFFGKDDEKEEDDDTSSKDTASNKTKDKTDDGLPVINKFAEALRSRGLISAEDEELAKITDYESFEKAIEKTIKSKEFADLNDMQKEYLEAMRDGLPHDYVIKHQNIMTQLNNLDDETLADEEISTKVYVTYLKQKGFDEAKATKFVDLAKTNNTLTEDAKEALTELKQIQQNTFQSEQEKRRKAIEDETKAIQDIQTSVKDMLTKGDSEIVKGLKISKTEGERIYNEMNTFSEKGEDGEKLTKLQKFAKENPAKYKAVVNYLFYSGFFEEGIENNKLFKKAKTDTVSEFERILGKEEKTLKGGGKTSGGDNVPDLVDALDSIL